MVRILAQVDAVPCGAAFAPPEDPRRVHRVRQGQSPKGILRLSRNRNRPSHPREDLPARDAHTGNPYSLSGSGPALNDLLGGVLEFMFYPKLGLPPVKTGRLRLLTVAGARRQSD